MPGLGNQQSLLGVWGLGVEGGGKHTDGKSPNFGVTETQVTCETASKFCHLSESLSAKENVKTDLEGIR